MKRLFSVSWFAFLVFILPVEAQTLTTLRDSGPRANCINLVIIAEGYTAAEEAKFGADASATLQTIIGNESWQSFATFINGYAIFVASAESGADIPSEAIVRNTAFDATFGTAGIDRLLTVNSSKINTVLTSTLPDWDVVVVLVNSTKYGGSGGQYSVTSLNALSPEIILHEMGHSFAKLLDEYIESTGGNPATFFDRYNGTNKTARTEIPWRRFIPSTTPLPTTGIYDEKYVGLFEGVNNYPTGVYRPTYTSKMRALNVPFGPVNLRAFVSEMHHLNLNLATALPTIVRQPESANVGAGQIQTLSVSATGVGPLTYQWSRDGLYIAGAIAPTLTLAPMSASIAGSYSVEITNAVGSVESAAATIALAAAVIAPSNAIITITVE